MRRSSSIFRPAASPMKNAMSRPQVWPRKPSPTTACALRAITVIDGNVLYGTFADQKSRLDAVLDG